MVMEYTSGKGLKEVGAMFSVAPVTVRREVVAAGHAIRPKHVVLNNVLIGRNHSRENSPTWKGGNPACPACGTVKSHARKGVKCWPCELVARKSKPRLPTDKLKTDESKLWRKRQEFRDWRAAVFDRDGYKCVACHANTRDLHPHHLDGFANYSEKRFDVSNGVTLCASDHKAFHRAHGYGGNTAEQFRLWLADLSTTYA
jgi:hypothetical protein